MPLMRFTECRNSRSTNHVRLWRESLAKAAWHLIKYRKECTPVAWAQLNSAISTADCTCFINLLPVHRAVGSSCRVVRPWHQGLVYANVDVAARSAAQIFFCARRACVARGSGDMPPQENFTIFQLLRCFLRPFQRYSCTQLAVGRFQWIRW